jgi:hypothetical protein
VLWQLPISHSSSKQTINISFKKVDLIGEIMAWREKPIAVGQLSG